MFPVHVMNESSCISSHCRILALSDPQDENFQKKCDHLHEEDCEDCVLIVETLKDVKKVVRTSESSAKEENIYDTEIAVNNILEWQKHIVRGFQQELGKTELLNKLDKNSIFWLRDFGMKMIPQKFMETQSEWFAKRGISNHIDCVFYKDDDGTISKKTYITLIENCKQDGYAVLCIFKHVLNQIKLDFTGVSKIYDRSDNAACYSAANVIAGKAAICEDLGMKLLHTEFNEPQRGKDQCDRDSAVIKKHVRSIMESGQDMCTANQICEAILAFGGKYILYL
jgi:hypothetical protein